MTEEERKEIVYLAMKDLYKDFNHSVNRLVILREFLHDVFNASEGQELKFDYPSVFMHNNKKSKKNILAESIMNSKKAHKSCHPVLRKMPSQE
jgi:hypothetical protein